MSLCSTPVDNAFNSHTPTLDRESTIAVTLCLPLPLRLFSLWNRAAWDVLPRWTLLARFVSELRAPPCLSQDLMRRTATAEDGLRWARVLSELMKSAGKLCPNSARAAYTEIVARVNVRIRIPEASTAPGCMCINLSKTTDLP